MTAALKGVSGQQHAPAALYPWESLVTHRTVGWVGPRAGLDWRKISSPRGFDPGPVVSPYTDWATRPTFLLLYECKMNIPMIRLYKITHGIDIDTFFLPLPPKLHI